MSDEKNVQPENENVENQQLSEEELNNVAGGTITFGGSLTLVSSYNNPIAPSLPPSAPPLSPDILAGKKGY